MNNPPPDYDLAQLKLPPNSIEAEQSVLGGLMIANDAWDSVAEMIAEKDFFRPEHRIIFRRMTQLVEASQPIDIVTLSGAMESEHEIDRVGGFSYLAEIARSTPSAANVRAYANVVRNRARARALITIGQNITELGFDESQSIDEREELAQAALMQLGDIEGEDIVSTNQALKELIDIIDRRHNQGDEITGLKTGFADIDKRTGGLQPSDLILIAGRPSMGKTSFAMNIVEHAAFVQRKPVLVFSMEMSRSQLFERMMASVGKISLQSIKTGKLTDEEWSRFSTATQRMKDAPLVIDDRPSLSIAQMRSRARKIHKKTPIALIVVDYLQLASAKVSKGANREQEVSSISRGLKALAKEMNCPLIALSQLNRECENGNDKRPKMSHLRDSGAIEQDADLIAMLYRDEVYHDDTDSKGVLEVLWRKFRNGEIGEDYLACRLDQSRFADLAAEARPQKSNVTPIKGNARGFDY